MRLGANFWRKASGLDVHCDYDLRDRQRIMFPRHMGSSVIDPVRVFMEAGGFNWRVFVIPDSANQTLAARQQFEDQLSALPGSFLLGVGAETDNSTGTAQFVYTIADKSSGETIMSSPIRYGVNSGNQFESVQSNKFLGRTMPFWLPEPWLVRAPGLITVQITNLATAAQGVCLALIFAEPTGVKEA